MAGHLGLIGFGAIAQAVVQTLCDRGAAPAQLTLLVRPTGVDAARAAVATIAGHAIARIDVESDLSALIAARPDLVVECAGHSAVADFGAEVLAAGIDLVVASTGSLADDALLARLRAAALSGGAQLTVPSGAIGGIDALAAARLSTLEAVTYTGRKPPHAWKGTPAETLLDLDGLSEPTVFFEGSAREAAQTYPKNANVAATLALAGLGMEDTQVRLIADPSGAGNIHEFEVRSSAVDFTIRLEGKASPANPKTSQATALSLVRIVINRSDAIIL
ncbi:MAG: aspartate dehydrogenase [Qingshengfaniella sp.]